MAIQSTKNDSGAFLIVGTILVVLGIVGVVVSVKKLVGAGVIGGLMVLAGLWIGRGERRDRRVLASGLRGEARVDKTETVHVKQGQTKLRLSLTVEVPGQAPYAATTVVWADLTDVPLIATLSSVPVRVDAEEPSRVLVEWATEGSRGPLEPSG